MLANNYQELHIPTRVQHLAPSSAYLYSRNLSLAFSLSPHFGIVKLSPPLSKINIGAYSNHFQCSLCYPAPACPGLAPHHLSIYQPFIGAILCPINQDPSYLTYCAWHTRQTRGILIKFLMLNKWFDAYVPSRFPPLIKTAYSCLPPTYLSNPSLEPSSVP